MSSPNAEEDHKWAPTHVQVTVLRGRGLRGKGKHGTSDVYTIIQLGKEKYCTCVAEKTTEPEWREECSFELPPGVLGGGQSAYPAAGGELILTVMHRALMGLDVFLGQAAIPLEKIYHESGGVKNEWYRLNSKTGKKEKERGDIQVTVQFTRNNLTASMYDLVMKDKSISTFSKLKERMRGKKRSNDEDSSSAVLPSGYGSLYRMRQRLPSDGGGEEDYEDDEGGEARRSKMRNFFLRGKLRKSSDTRSSTSLGSESSESSSRGGSLSPTAGISVVVSDLSNSPSNSSNLTADNSPEHTANTSPKATSPKCEFREEAGEITIIVPQPSVCVNGSHGNNIQVPVPGSGKAAGSLGLGLLQKPLPLSMSLQNLSPWASADLPKGLVGDGRRWSFDKPDEEEKAAIAAALEQSGPMLSVEEERLGDAAPLQASSSTAESESQGKKQRRNFFSHGKPRLKDESESTPAVTEEKHKGWFGSKDSHSKPSLVVLPNLEPGIDLHDSPLHHTNPFCHSQTTPPPISPCNPFFSLLQQNPFFGDMAASPALKPSLPPLPYLSSFRPPIAQLFPRANNTNIILTQDSTATLDCDNGADGKSEVMAKTEQELILPDPLEGKKPVGKNASNPFISVGVLEPDAEWDESFEVFAAGRLQSLEDLNSKCKTEQSTPCGFPLEDCNNQGMLLDMTGADQNTNISEMQGIRFKASRQVTSTNKRHLDTFAQLLETLPEQSTLNTNPQKLNDCIETNKVNSTTNSNVLTNTNMHQNPCLSQKLNSSSTDPGSSGLGSSAEEDFPSCFSSYSVSEKLSESSSDDADAQNTRNAISFWPKLSESELVITLRSSESDKDDNDGSWDLSVVDVAQQTVIQHWDVDEKVESNGPQGSRSPVLTEQQSFMTVSQMKTEVENLETLNFLQEQSSPSDMQQLSKVSLQADDDNELKDAPDFSKFKVDLSEVLNNPSVSVNYSPDLMNPATRDDELCFTGPSQHIMTSSPCVSLSVLDTIFETTTFAEQEGGQSSLATSGLFGKFNFIELSNDTENTLLHTEASDQSAGSFLQSLYVSADSQHYQTCQSHPSSRLFSGSDSEPTEAPHSANSTLCGELSEIWPCHRKEKMAASSREGSPSPCSPPNDGINHIDQFETLCRSDRRKNALEEIADDFDSQQEVFANQILPKADLIGSAEDNTSCNPNMLGERDVQSPADSPICSSQCVTLHRTQSEGTLKTAHENDLMPSFVSDPGVTQESSSTKPGPSFPLLTFFEPSLTAKCSSPSALCFLPSFANASVRSPPSTAPALANAKPLTDAVLSEEMQQQQASNQQNSPHPVKPLTTAMLAEEKRTEGRSVLATGLEKLKSTIHPGRSSHLPEQEADRKKSLTEGAGSYYHLTHNELVALLMQREAELEKQKAEFERQGALLAKREVELKKLKPQVRDLEDYIDTLLVRIMEQKPTLLQVGSKFK